MIVHVLVEGPSERALIESWAPRAFPGHTFRAHPHEGKGSLPRRGKKNPTGTGVLDLLPATLEAYAATRATEDDAIVVLVDADDDDCTELVRQLSAMAGRLAPRPQRLVFRIAIEETEAFYLGDLHALRAAFPDADMAKATRYAPDSVVGTAELFGEIVDDGGMNKVSWATEMGPRLTTQPGKSRSPSFRKLHAGIARVVAKAAKPKKRKPKHWKSRFSAKRKHR